MAKTYYEIKDFQIGMDLRKSAMSAPAGSLRLLRNAHITVGGEIEKRYAYSPYGLCTPDTKGLVLFGGIVFTLRYGNALDPFIQPPLNPSLNAVGVLTLPNTGRQMARLLDWDIYAGKIYTITQATDNSIWHFYNDTPVIKEVVTLTSSGPPPVYATTYENMTGSSCRTFGDKMYITDGELLRFSSTGNPAAFYGTNAGYIWLAQNDGDSSEMIGLEIYYDKMAVFFKKATQLWLLNADQNKNQFYQTVRGCGTISPRSIRQYAGNDIFFLQSDGIRSLRARDLTMTAGVADVGSPLDPLIQQLFREKHVLGQDEWTTSATGLISPKTGRFWMVFTDRIYVLSQFSSPKISAWSVYDTPDPAYYVTDALTVDPMICIRDSSHKVWAYQDPDRLTYDDCVVEVELPFLDFDKPAQLKTFTGLDLGVGVGTDQAGWTVDAAMDPANPTVQETLGVYTQPTFLGGRMPMQGYSTHISLRLKSQWAGPQSLNRVFIHYEDGETS